ncbi:hypothetical protein BH11MYX1_BH11MYX1_37730 [soil metagenome]
MRDWFAAVAATLCAGGCSFIYNPNNLDHTGDGGDHTVDAAPDAHVTLDADPALLELDTIAPAIIYEGQGAVGSTSRPALVTIGGHHITGSFTVAVTPSNPDMIVGTAQRSNSGDYIVITIGMGVNTTDATTKVPLTFTVNEEGAPTRTITGVSLQYLPELYGSGTDHEGALVIDASTLEDRYSEIVAGAVSFTVTSTNQAARATLHSMSKIAVGNVTANGGNGGNGTAGLGGAGGCPGGAQGTPGGCGVGGGGTTDSGAGGGGGGFGGAGLPTVSGGAKHGDPQILTFDSVLGDGTDTNQSSGGAGGTFGGVASGAGGGGGGGATLELVAEGSISAGVVTTNGGDGGTGGSVGPLGAAGGGGGGSGGVIVFRSASGPITTTAVSSVGGSGGALQGTGTMGGKGGVGRIRWDSSAIDALASTPPGHRAPSFAHPTATITNVQTPMLGLVGTSGDIVDFYTVDSTGSTHVGEPMHVTLTADSAFKVTLVDGYNHFCTRIAGTAMEAELPTTCIDLVFLPD